MRPWLLHQLLADAASAHASRPAVFQGGRVLSWAELAAASARLASALRGLGVAEGDRVGILAAKSIESVVALYGVLAAGAVYVPLDPQAPPARQGHILRSCGVRVLVADGPLAAALAADREATAGVRAIVRIGAPAPVPWREVAWEELAGLPEAPFAPGSDTRPAYVLHTSGSTGAPKGVTISHANALAFVEMATAFFAIGEWDRLASHAPFHFDLSVFDLYCAARAGAAVVLVPDGLGVFPPRLARFVEEARITVWNSVASVISLLAARGDLDERRFDDLRLVVFSGDVLPPKHLRRARARMPGAAFYNVYGQTEANSSTFFRVEAIPEDDRWRIPIGRPFPNFEVFVLDEGGRPVTGAGEVGELYVRGATVALGYWGDPARTAAAFVEDPLVPWPARAYRTGDLVTRDDAGELVYVGRRDRQVKSRGYRIQIDEIDLVLNGHPLVREAAVVDVPDELLGARLHAFVQRAGRVEAAELLDHLSRALPPYMVPESVRFVDELPRTQTGKVDRGALRAARAQEARR